MADKQQERKLTLKQERFCHLYVSKDFFGDGTGAYLEAYGDWHKEKYRRVLSEKVASASATRMLGLVKIYTRINELLSDAGFNEQNVDKQHLSLINQHADKNVKLGAIREFNRIKKRIEGNQELVLKIEIS